MMQGNFTRCIPEAFRTPPSNHRICPFPMSQFSTVLKSLCHWSLDLAKVPQNSLGFSKLSLCRSAWFWFWNSGSGVVVGWFVDSGRACKITEVWSACNLSDKAGNAPNRLFRADTPRSISTVLTWNKPSCDAAPSVNKHDTWFLLSLCLRC